MKKTLAIETSCDDTSLAIVTYKDGVFSVDAIKAYSQIADHQKYGGVVPEIAFRLHSEQILALTQYFLDDIQTVDSISVTTNPWLVGSLLVWKTVAHMLSQQFQKPLLPVHHIYGHIFSLLLERNISELAFPWVVLTASGWHNEIYVVDKNIVSEWKYRGELPFLLEDLEITKLWKTLDDAAGECFDKVARMLWWPYPWGARIGQQALQGKKNTDYVFKKAMMADHDNPYDFSFSWMKSQVYTLLQKLEKNGTQITEQVVADISYMFQEAIVETLGKKLAVAARTYNAKTIGITWWVSANDRLFDVASKMIEAEFLQSSSDNTVLENQHIPALIRPTKKLYSTDNGAMIGVVGLLSK